jgi:hypothetical protein
MNADRLLARNTVIVFEAHGPAAGLVRKTLARLGQREISGADRDHPVQVHRHVVADHPDGGRSDPHVVSAVDGRQDLEVIPRRVALRPELTSTSQLSEPEGEANEVREEEE